IALKAFAPLTAAMLDDPTLRQAYPFGAAKAQALLAEAGWQPGADGIRTKGGARLEIVLNAIEYGGGPEPTAQLIQSSLREVGIDVKIKAQARPPWYEDNYRCATHGPVMFLRAVDPDGLYPLFHWSLVGGNFNWSCVKNAKLDQLLEQGRREFDPATRRAIYLTIDQIAQMRAQLHLDEPLPQQYGRFVANALRGDLGTSIRSRRPVATEIAENVASTAQLALASMAVAIAIGVPLGLLAALFRNTWL